MSGSGKEPNSDENVDVLFQCLLMDQMDWEEEKLYVQFSTIYLLKQTVKN